MRRARFTQALGVKCIYCLVYSLSLIRIAIYSYKKRAKNTFAQRFVCRFLHVFHHTPEDDCSSQLRSFARMRCLWIYELNVYHVGMPYDCKIPLHLLTIFILFISTASGPVHGRKGLRVACLHKYRHSSECTPINNLRLLRNRLCSVLEFCL